MHPSRLLPVLLALSCAADPPAPLAPPLDTAADVPRTGDAGPFDTMRLLDLDLAVRLHDDVAGALPPKDHLVVATLVTPEGSVAWRGAFSADGRLHTTVALPAATADLVLALDAPGFAPRRVDLPGVLGSATLRRTFVLVADPLAPRPADTDGDGVPDAQDGAPADPRVTFANAVPAEGFLTVAFEDMYGGEKAGDADFNDFVVDYRVVEEVLGDRVVSLRIEAIGRRQWSAWDHAFGMALRFDGAALVTVEQYDAGAPEPSAEERFAVAGGPGVEQAVVELFHSTRRAIGRRAIATIRFAEPVDRATLTAAPYDPYLHVWSTGRDVHLPGRATLPRAPHLYRSQTNPADAAFQSESGWRWALFVPSEWVSPDETQYIGRKYPEFDAWRKRIGASAG